MLQKEGAISIIINKLPSLRFKMNRMKKYNKTVQILYFLLLSSFRIIII